MATKAQRHEKKEFYKKVAGTDLFRKKIYLCVLVADMFFKEIHKNQCLALQIRKC